MLLYLEKNVQENVWEVFREGVRQVTFCNEFAERLLLRKSCWVRVYKDDKESVPPGSVHIIVRDEAGDFFYVDRILLNYGQRDFLNNLFDLFKTDILYFQETIVKEDSESTKQAKEIVKVFEHWLNGGKIQARYQGGSWTDLLDEPRWNTEMTNYRIKPEPRTKIVWVAWNADDKRTIFKTDECPEGKWSAIQKITLVEGEFER